MAGLSTGNRIAPWCFQDKTASDVGPKTDYPIGFTRDQWWEIYFRVKDWDITIDWSASASCTAGSATASASANGPGNASSTSGLSSERNFTCQLNASFLVVPNDDDYQETSNDDAFAIAGVMSQFQNPTIGINIDACYRVDDLYYPKFYKTFGILSQCNGGWEEGFPGYIEAIYSEPDVESPNPLYTPYNIPISVNGVSGIFEGTKFSANTGDGAGSATASANLTSITLTPKSYWPYDPGDGGGPIWDASTGSQLRDPFSVQSW